MDRIKGLGAEDLWIPELDAMVHRESVEWEAEKLCMLLDLAWRHIRVVMLTDEAGKGRNKKGCTIVRWRSDLAEGDSFASWVFCHLDVERASEVRWLPAETVMC